MSADEEELKAQQVQEALKGLQVEYSNHYGKSLTANMAKVNGYSIVWHEYSYCAGEAGMVEVMFPDGEVDGYVPISKLREMVT